MARTRLRVTPRVLIRIGISLVVAAVVLIGPVGAFQDPSETSVGCDASSCTVGGVDWPTGWGWWLIAGVATVGVFMIVAGVVVRVVRR